MSRKKVYSTYEAKARLSELLGRVRKGESITITYRGEPVAEVRPIEKPDSALEERFEELQRRGILSRPTKKSVWKPLVHRPGALKRFLDERE